MGINQKLVTPNPNMTPPKRTKPSSKRRWFILHSWLGLNLSVFISFVFITGTIAVFSNEIDWLITPKMRASQISGEMLPLSTLHENARRVYPNWSILFLNKPDAPWFTAQAAARRPDKGLGRIFIDPYTGDVLGDGPWFNTQRFFRETHRKLMLPTAIGVPIVSFLSFLLLASIGTSLMVYKKWWQGFFRWPRTTNQRIFWGDLHRLLGIWSLWFLLIVSLTGVWYFLEATGFKAPPLPSYGEATIQEVQGEISSLALQQKAQTGFPGLTIHSFTPPLKPGDPYVFKGQAQAALVRPHSNFISIDGQSGAIIKIARAEELTWHQRLSEMADPLHFGTFGGYGTRIIWFIFGLALSVLSISGVCIYAKRSARTLSHLSQTTVFWRGMPVGQYITLVFIVTYITALLLFLST